MCRQKVVLKLSPGFCVVTVHGELSLHRGSRDIALLALPWRLYGHLKPPDLHYGSFCLYSWIHDTLKNSTHCMMTRTCFPHPKVKDGLIIGARLTVLISHYLAFHMRNKNWNDESTHWSYYSYTHTHSTEVISPHGRKFHKNNFTPGTWSKPLTGELIGRRRSHHCFAN